MYRYETVGYAAYTAALRYPNKPAVIDPETRLTYRQLWERGTQVARALSRLGVRKGNRIGVLARNSAEYATVYVASALLGAALVPLNVLLAARELEYMLNDSECHVLFYGGEFAETVEELAPSLKTVKALVSIGKGRHQDHDYATLFRSQPTTNNGDWEQVTGEDEHVVIYTSGTTGTPKGAILTHRNHISTALMFAIEYEMTPEDIILIPIPLAHKGGLILGLQTAITVGATVIFPRATTPDVLVDTMVREKVSYLLCVPTILNRILDLMEKYQAELALRKIMHGGSAISPVTAKRLIDGFSNIRIFQGYGTTEVGQITALPAEHYKRKHETTGRPAMLCEVRIVDECNSDVAVGEVGEIIVRGPQVFKGYNGLPEATSEAMTGEWFHTGDLGRIDDDGYITVVDRKKDMIVSGGFNVYPQEVEKVLAGCPGIAEVAVFGMPDPDWVEAVWAVVVPEPYAKITEESVRTYARQQLAKYKVPKVIKLVDSLPHTHSGKIAKHLLKKMVKAQP